MKNYIKALLIVTIIFNYSVLFSQTKLPIKFEAEYKKDIALGEERDKNLIDLDAPLNVVFDGKTLKIEYKTGEKWMNDLPVISYEKRESKEFGKLESEVYILTVKRDKLIQLISIMVNYNPWDVDYSIWIPYVSNFGVTTSYRILGGYKN